jgi:hypothetical protein
VLDQSCDCVESWHVSSHGCYSWSHWLELNNEIVALNLYMVVLICLVKGLFFEDVNSSLRGDFSAPLPLPMSFSLPNLCSSFVAIASVRIALFGQCLGKFIRCDSSLYFWHEKTMSLSSAPLVSIKMERSLCFARDLLVKIGLFIRSAPGQGIELILSIRNPKGCCSTICFGVP